MLTIEKIREKLADRKPTVVAKKTGLSYHTVWRIQRDPPKVPTYNVIKKLSDYLTEQ